MADLRMVASAASYLAVATFYLYLGGRLYARGAEGDSARAGRLFGLWWTGLGLHSSIAGVLVIGLMLDVVTPLAVAVATYMAAIIIAGMSYGLLHFMVYLLTGSRRTVRVLAVVYATLAVGMLAAVAYSGPRGAHMVGWVPIIDYARPEGSALDLIASLVFVVPPFLASGVYATLFFRIREPAKRWRIALTGGALFAWLVTSLFLGALQDDVAAALGRAIALGAAVSAHLAYSPPRWAQRRFGARPLEHEVVAPAPDPMQRLARREALAARARELV